MVQLGWKSADLSQAAAAHPQPLPQAVGDAEGDSLLPVNPFASIIGMIAVQAAAALFLRMKAQRCEVSGCRVLCWIAMRHVPIDFPTLSISSFRRRPESVCINDSKSSLARFNSI